MHVPAHGAAEEHGPPGTRRAHGCRRLRIGIAARIPGWLHVGAPRSVGWRQGSSPLRAMPSVMMLPAWCSVRAYPGVVMLGRLVLSRVWRKTVSPPANRLSRGDVSGLGWRLGCLMCLTLLLPTVSATAADHPLEPIDLSSPRATLHSLLSTGDAYFELLSHEYWDRPSRSVAERLHELGDDAQRTLDLSEVPPAARYEIGRDALVYLYEVLSRIELPPMAEIPAAQAYEQGDEHAKADGKPPRWTVPHTEITIARVDDGPQAGNFLFTPATVARASEFYQKARALPYRRDVPLAGYAEKRHYLSMDSWMIPPRSIEALPGWMKRSFYGQAVWKWLALGLLVLVTLATVVAVHRLARWRLSGHSVGAYLRRLVTPVTLLVLTPLVLDMANRELTLTGRVAEGLNLITQAVAYFSLAWIVWTGSVGLAEAIISLPKIPAQSLNAHLLRLAARVVGIAAVIAIIFYVSSQLGAPLYGIVAGLGVGGIAIALAAQNTIEHFIGSLNLFADRPVRVGDLCRYGEDPAPDWQRIGVVESIGLRSTRIRGIDNSLTTIPNGDFSKMHLVNYSVRSRTLLLTVLGLRYETTDDQLRFLLVSLRSMLIAHPRVVDDEPLVRFKGFGEFALNVELRVNINTADLNEFRAIREDIFLRVMKIVKEAGTGFAFPSRTVYQSQDNGLDSERQRAAEAQVRAWCSAQELPFPNFNADYRKQFRNTLDYPPEGSPEASG
jgi:MscS family membrane protein